MGAACWRSRELVAESHTVSHHHHVQGGVVGARDGNDVTQPDDAVVVKVRSFTSISSSTINRLGAPKTPTGGGDGNGVTHDDTTATRCHEQQCSHLTDDHRQRSSPVIPMTMVSNPMKLRQRSTFTLHSVLHLQDVHHGSVPSRRTPSIIIVNETPSDRSASDRHHGPLEEDEEDDVEDPPLVPSCRVSAASSLSFAGNPNASWSCLRGETGLYGDAFGSSTSTSMPEELPRYPVACQ